MKTHTANLLALAAAAPLVSGTAVANSSRIQFAGVNLPGLANDVSILGSAFSQFEGSNCNASYDVYPFFNTPDNYHDWHAKGFNLFRLPVAWQHAQATLYGELSQMTMYGLDKLVDAITSNGSVAILDIHNYARWYCSIIGQPENNIPSLSTLNVTDDHFVDLWTKLAEHYKSNDKVMFQLMNEPHDLSVTKWAKTNQKVINAIRRANATQPILVSGTQFARLVDWQIYSMGALSRLSDPADNILFDFHQYFDDAGGAYGVCEPWATFLPKFQSITNCFRDSDSKAIITEFGGTPVPACVELFHELLAFFEDNRDVWYGWTAWGPFMPGDLHLTLNGTFSVLTDVLARYAPLS